MLDPRTVANPYVRTLLGVFAAQGVDVTALLAGLPLDAALLDYDRRRLRGLVLEEGGPNSHVAIVERALGIAAVGEIALAG